MSKQISMKPRAQWVVVVCDRPESNDPLHISVFNARLDRIRAQYMTGDVTVMADEAVFEVYKYTAQCVCKRYCPPESVQSVFVNGVPESAPASILITKGDLVEILVLPPRKPLPLAAA